MHGSPFSECHYVRIGPCKCDPKEGLWSAEGVGLRNDHEEAGMFLEFISVCPGSDSRSFFFLCFRLQFYINLIGAQLTHHQMHTFEVHSFDEFGQIWSLG